MAYTIRSYHILDLPMLKSWWLSYGLTFTEDILPSRYTYILESNEEPIMSACLFFIYGTKTCMIENAIAKPNSEREGALDYLFQFLTDIAKARGMTSILIFSYVDGLKKKYAELGFQNTVNNCSFFLKTL